MTLTQKTATVAIAILIMLGLAHAQQPKTVTDFYLAMPSGSYDLLPKGESESYLFSENDNTRGKVAIAKFRRSLIKVEDIKNGYLRLESQSADWDGSWAEIALFKKTDGSYLVALAQVECGPACGGWLEFLTFAEGKWTDVSKQFFPTLTEKQKAEQDCLFELPRTGRILKMSCGNTEDDSKQQKVFKFEWNGTKFINR